MNFPRSGGILLHPTSLPGPYGIGDLGPQAYGFIDWLAEAGCRLWQVLPLGPTGYGDSPYQCFSAFAGNPYLISPELLLQDGLLTESDLSDRPEFSASRVDFGLVIPWRLSLLERAFQRFQDRDPVELREAFAAFRAENAAWLDDYALFMALKEFHGGGSWSDWPAAIRKREEKALKEARVSLAQSILRHSFYQLLFSRQWSELREHAHQKGIQVIGDIPIFVSADGADVWSHPELFFLDEERRPTVVAGVPPDYFSATGQLWGNPLYRWDVHKKSGYAWWMKRFRSILGMVDVVRLDHFRGFAGYWEIQAGSATAEVGRWVPGPGVDFFDALSESLKDLSVGDTLPIIAEDLGVITTDVVELRDHFHFPGMKILQFGFSGPENPFLPHSYVSNCVAYTGTHDNDTALGWFVSAPAEERDFALRYLFSDGSEFAWDLVRSVWASVAMFAVAPMQDMLGLGTDARMNFPSKLGGNWAWRMNDTDLSGDLQRKLRELNYLYHR